MSRAIYFVRVVLIVLFLAIFGSFSSAISAINSDQFSSEMPQSDKTISTFVYVDSSKNMQAVLADLELLGCDVELPFKYVPAVPVNFYNYDTIDKALTIPFVERIEELRIISPAMNTSVPNVKAAPSTEYSPETAHDAGYTGKGIAIAIIDSGVDNEHPVFTDAFIAGADFTQPESPLNPYDGTVDPDDVNGHGTGVASFALGRGGHQGVGPGVAPDAGLIDLKIRDNGPTLAQPMARAIEWCYDNKDTNWGNGFTGVDVISISAGTGQQDSVVDQLITFVVSEGLTVVTAATNSGTSFEDNPNNAADYWADNAIIVGGTDDQRTVDRADDVHWPQSTWGPRTDDGDDNPYEELKPDVVAPATDLVFADHTKGPDRRIRPTGWATGSGTSFATPHVSGVVALMLEANPDIKPSADSQPIRKILHKTAEARGDPYNKNLSEKYNVYFGYGIVDAYEAVKEAESYVEINHPPEIKQFYAEPSTIAMDTSTMVYAAASDIDEEILSYELSASSGTIEGSNPPWKWTAPNSPGTYQLVLTVTDPSGASDEAKTSVVVTEGPPNSAPVITSFTSTHSTLPPGDSTTLQVTASDPDGDTLFYIYEASIGTVKGSTSTATYTAPEEEGTAQITVTVSDGTDGNVKAKLDITIKKLGAGLPPEITSIDISPMTIVEGDDNAVVVLTAAVERMDAEIDLVYADISFLGGLKFAYLNDVGAPPDNTPDDGIYSLELSDLGNLGAGKYDIRVTASDIEGRTSSVKSVQMEVIESSTGEPVKSESDDDIIFEFDSFSIKRNTFFIFLIVTIILIVIIFAIARPDRITAKRSNQ